MKLRSKHIFVILIIGTILLYIKAIGYDFLNFDDNKFIVNNDWLDLSKSDLISIFTEQREGHYHPITWLSLAIQKKIFGLDAGGFQIVNILVYLGIGYLVYHLTMRLFKRKRIALIATSLFILHPIHVESIVWKSAHSTLLYSLFLVLAIIQYLKYLDKRKKKLLFSTYLFFILACLSKSAAIILPLLLISIDYLKNNLSRFSVLAKAPMLLISITFGLLAIKSSQEFGSLDSATESYSLFQRLLVINRATFFYAQKFFWPFSLSGIHFKPRITDGTLPLIYYISPIANILFVTAGYLMFKFYSKTKEFLFIILFYLINIGLVSHIIPIGDTIAAERFGFIAILSFSWMLGHLFDVLEVRKNKIRLIAIRSAVIGLILISLFQTKKRIDVWESNELLFQDMVDKYPDSFYAHFSLGVALQLKDQSEKALNTLLIADSLNNHSSKIKNSLGLAYDKLDDPENALKFFSAAINLDPRFIDPYINRSYIYDQIHEYKKASKDLSVALGIGEKKNLVLLNRSKIRYKLKNYEGSILDCDVILDSDNKDHMAYHQRAISYQSLELYDSAITSINKSILLMPKNINYLNLRGLLRNQLGQYDKAIEDFSQVISIDPNASIAYTNRGLSRKNLHLYDAAITDLSQSIILSPDFIPAYFERAECLIKLGENDQAILDLNTFLNQRPQSNRALLLRATCKYAVGDNAAACMDWFKARAKKELTEHCKAYL